MIWPNRILMLTLILCLSRTPIPWGHSHDSMDAGQLAVHLQTYHPATAEGELPEGWHWHVTHIELFTKGVAGQYPIAVLEEYVGKLLNTPTLDATNTEVTLPAVLADCSASTETSLAHAVRQQRTYLRLNILLI